MAAQSTTTVTAKGICSFCKGEFDKEDMTRHLKQCEQRMSDIATNAKDSTKQKIRFFHLEVEGKYNPQYWMHLEIPVSEPLETLDYFLRDIWVECCEHLSAFDIAGTDYSSEPEDLYFGMAEVVEEQQTEEEEEEEEDDAVNVIDLEAIIDFIPSPHKEMLASTLLPELRKAWSTDDLVAFLKGKLKAIPKRRKRGTPKEQDNYWDRYYQKWLLEYLLALVEDRSLNVPLGKVLKVGQKFSYQYDFGSTTYLNLRVVASREGVAQDEKPSVELLARNVPPVILCKTCGKPATSVISGYYDVEENSYCDECARKIKNNFYGILPIVNSPRVGVCGYTGDQDYELDWDELDDEELEEEEEH